MNIQSQDNILITESGSTKADWVSIANGEIKRWKSEGLNALILKDLLEHKLKNALAKGEMLKGSDAWQVYFYGAGCTLEDMKTKVRDTFCKFLNVRSISVENDLIGAAKSVSGDHPSIVGILGTGSAIGLFDGKRFVDYTMSGGYLFGDEGSAFSIGQEIIKRYVRAEFDTEQMIILRDLIGLNHESLIGKLYNHERPNFYMASFGSLVEKLSEKYKQDILEKVFNRFIFDRVLKQDRIRELPIHLVGSVAAAHEDLIRALFSKEDLTIGKIVKSPIDGLLDYHLKHLKQ